MSMIWTRYHVELAVEALRASGEAPDLSRLNLAGATLTGADLAGAAGIAALYVPGMSSRGDYLYAVQHDCCVMLTAGCFWGTLEEFIQRVSEKRGAEHTYIAAARNFAAALEREHDE